MDLEKPPELHLECRRIETFPVKDSGLKSAEDASAFLFLLLLRLPLADAGEVVEDEGGHEEEEVLGRV